MIVGWFAGVSACCVLAAMGVFGGMDWISITGVTVGCACIGAFIGAGVDSWN